VVVVAIIVTAVLLVFVIPQFESLFQGFGADLPAFTQFVVELVAVRAQQGWLIILGLVAAVMTFGYFKKRSRKFNEFLDRLLLKIAGHRRDHGKGGNRALYPHLSTMFAAGVPLGRSHGIGGWRHRQHRLRKGNSRNPDRGRHRPATAARHGSH
jgi:type IV pilus assembly protein PilC